jgi:diaminopimelate decarboxylase
MAALYAHPTIMLGQDGFNGWLAAGPSRILGSICMESDVLVRGVSFPRIPSIGDKLVFLDAGGYDASMAWSFGKGTSRDDRPR